MSPSFLHPALEPSSCVGSRLHPGGSIHPKRKGVHLLTVKTGLSFCCIILPALLYCPNGDDVFIICYTSIKGGKSGMITGLVLNFTQSRSYSFTK